MLSKGELLVYGGAAVELVGPVLLYASVGLSGMSITILYMGGVLLMVTGVAAESRDYRKRTIGNRQGWISDKDRLKLADRLNIKGQ